MSGQGVGVSSQGDEPLPPRRLPPWFRGSWGDFVFSGVMHRIPLEPWEHDLEDCPCMPVLVGPQRLLHMPLFPDWYPVGWIPREPALRRKGEGQ